MKMYNILGFVLVLLIQSCKPGPISQEALALFADGKVAYQQGDLEYARDTFIEVLSMRQDFTEAAVMLGKSCYFLEEFDSAIEFLSEKWKKYPQWYEAGYWLGRSYMAKEEYLKAEEVWLKLLSYNSQDFRVLHQSGLLKMSQGDYLKAMEYLKKSLLQRNELAQTGLTLGQIYYSQDMLPEAVDALKNVISIGDGKSPVTEAAQQILEVIQ